MPIAAQANGSESWELRLTKSLVVRYIPKCILKNVETVSTTCQDTWVAFRVIQAWMVPPLFQNTAMGPELRDRISTTVSSHRQSKLQGIENYACVLPEKNINMKNTENNMLLFPRFVRLNLSSFSHTVQYLVG